MRPEHYALLFEFVKWAGEQSHIAGIALVGACARDEEEDEDSHMNFVIISDKKAKTLEAILHQFQFDLMEQATKEEWGILTSVRIEYANGIEAEYGIVEEEWVKNPLDQGIIDVITKGFKVIWEREALFGAITQFIANHKH